jgi:hypothetical protein
VILLAFDVDGTLDTSAGPVLWSKVLGLVGFMSGYVHLGIVSPSAARPKDDTPFYGKPDSTRTDNLRFFAQAFPGAALRLYVSDNNDEQAAIDAGWAFCHPLSFARGLP